MIRRLSHLGICVADLERYLRFYREGLSARRYPAQVVWGANDRMIGPERRSALQEALGVDDATLLPAKHFLPEDRAGAVAEAVSALAS